MSVYGDAQQGVFEGDSIGFQSAGVIDLRPFFMVLAERLPLDEAG